MTEFVVTLPDGAHATVTAERADVVAGSLILSTAEGRVQLLRVGGGQQRAPRNREPGYTPSPTPTTPGCFAASVCTSAVSTGSHFRTATTPGAVPGDRPAPVCGCRPGRCCDPHWRQRLAIVAERLAQLAAPRAHS